MVNRGNIDIGKNVHEHQVIPLWHHGPWIGGEKVERSKFSIGHGRACYFHEKLEIYFKEHGVEMAIYAPEPKGNCLGRKRWMIFYWFLRIISSNANLEVVEWKSKGARLRWVGGLVRRVSTLMCLTRGLRCQRRLEGRNTARRVFSCSVSSVTHPNKVRDIMLDVITGETRPPGHLRTRRATRKSYLRCGSPF